MIDPAEEDLDERIPAPLVLPDDPPIVVREFPDEPVEIVPGLDQSPRGVDHGEALAERQPPGQGIEERAADLDGCGGDRRHATSEYFHVIVFENPAVAVSSTRAWETT